MGMNITPEISKKSKYWISRHRYYELKHFCLQYYNWHREWKTLVESNLITKYDKTVKSDDISRKVEENAIRAESLARKMDLVRKTAYDSSTGLQSYIFKAVTENLSYTYLREKCRIPCCKDVYYEEYRRFFWLLDKARD